MEGLQQSLSQYQGPILLVLIVLSVAAAAVSTINFLSLRKHRQQWTGLLSGAGGESFEGLLQNALRENKALRTELQAAERRIAELERRMEKAKRHLGLVRFDAFEDVGGSQSFALALYDDNGDGAVINGLVGRTDCRVYAKPLVGGRSDRNLSQEERRAIEEALTRAVKSVVTESA